MQFWLSESHGLSNVLIFIDCTMVLRCLKSFQNEFLSHSNLSVSLVGKTKMRVFKWEWQRSVAADKRYSFHFSQYFFIGIGNNKIKIQYKYIETVWSWLKKKKYFSWNWNSNDSYAMYAYSFIHSFEQIVQNVEYSQMRLSAASFRAWALWVSIVLFYFYLFIACLIYDFPCSERKNVCHGPSLLLGYIWI